MTEERRQFCKNDTNYATYLKKMLHIQIRFDMNQYGNGNNEKKRFN